MTAQNRRQEDPMLEHINDTLTDIKSDQAEIRDGLKKTDILVGQINNLTEDIKAKVFNGLSSDVANIKADLQAHNAVEKAKLGVWSIAIPVLALIVAMLATIPLYFK